MAFRALEPESFARFNSSTSAEFLNKLLDAEVKAITGDIAKPSHRTFAPSTMRCKRLSWFRLRGVEPDEIEVTQSQKTMNFYALIGTSVHNYAQSILSSELMQELGISWTSPRIYSKLVKTGYDYKFEENGYETFITIDNPPVRFACDGIISYRDKYYIIEIKTVDFGAFQKLGDVLSKHIDQARCYSTFLKIPNVLFLYIDRQYGNIKCFETSFSEYDWDSVLNDCADIQTAVNSNLAPVGLHKGDSMCISCKYKIKCAQWG